MSVIVSTMPRGSLQLAQPARLPDILLRAYAREYQLDDRLTWQAMLQRRPTRLRDAFRQGDRFLTDYLAPAGIAFAAAVPLAAPLLDGYPGALHVYRSSEMGSFSDEEIKHLGEVSAEADQVIARARAGRQGPSVEVELTPRPRSQFFIFNASGRQLLPGVDFDVFDERLRREIAEHVQLRVSRIKADSGVTTHRAQLPDSREDLWTFRAAVYPNYPAVGEGPFIALALLPNIEQWLSLRSSDFAADPELARLIPAMKFMRSEYQRGPTLNEIARQVHLSPFHFHRRFTELLGQTPKHFLLECQITEAKIELIARRKELAQIARDCGFAHQSHFTSRFKQATGLTPTRWRRAALEAGRQ